MGTPRPEELLKLEGERDFRSEYFESFLGQPVERTRERRHQYVCGKMDHIHLGDDGWVSINPLYTSKIGLNDELICKPFPHTLNDASIGGIFVSI